MIKLKKCIKKLLSKLSVYYNMVPFYINSLVKMKLAKENLFIKIHINLRISLIKDSPLSKRYKLNVYKTFKRRSSRLVNVLYTIPEIISRIK